MPITGADSLQQMFAIKIVLIFLTTTLAEECRKKHFGQDSHVCVCDANYCDTVPPLEKLKGPNVEIYTSNRDGLRFAKTKMSFTRIKNGGSNDIVINFKKQYQKIIGWGGAFTDSTGLNIKSLKESAQQKLLESYFSDGGIEYTLCRVPIGGTDFSTRAYTYDGEKEDPELKNFKLAEEDFQYKIPFIKKALEITNNKLKLFGSAWVAPEWMQNGGDYKGLKFLKKSMYQSWADYHLRFLEEYEKQGISYFGLTTGNEPGTAFIPYTNISTVGWLPSFLSQWIANNLGPTIRNSKYSSLKLMVLDDQRYYLPWVLNLMFKNETVRNSIDGIATHWYADTLIPPELVELTHEEFPEKFILSTEGCIGVNKSLEHVELGSWYSGERYAADIIQDLLIWGSGWVDWNMVLDMKGGPTYIYNYVNAPIIVNATAGEFYKQPMFYALGHFSKFIPPDSFRIESSCVDKEVKVVAFKRPDNGTVVVVLNKKEEDVVVTFTDKSKGSIQLKLTKKSITTFVYYYW